MGKTKSWNHEGHEVSQRTSCTFVPFVVLELFTIQLDDQLLIHWQLNIFALGQIQNPRLVIVAIDFQPARQRAVAGKFFRQLKYSQFIAFFAYRNRLGRAHFIGRNVDLTIVDSHVPVTHQLARLAPRLRESKAEYDVVQPPLQLLQQLLAGHAS